MSQFSPGETVRLKSGGPMMTVRGNKAMPSTASPAYYTNQGIQATSVPTYSFERPVTCDWFTNDEVTLHSAVFEENQLKSVELP